MTKSGNRGMMKTNQIEPQQGDLFFVESKSCWTYEFDGSTIMLLERWPLEELFQGDIVVVLEQRMIPYNQAYSIESRIFSKDVQLVKIIPPSGKVGWLISRHLKKLTGKI